eukprot:COSAG02_NODE_419_length_22613_cov_22.994492_31_plen_38_part_01
MVAPLLLTGVAAMVNLAEVRTYARMGSYGVMVVQLGGT